MSTTNPTDAVTPPPVTVAPLSTTVEPSARQDSGVRVKRWNREEYYRLGEQGWFSDRHVELIDGEIVEVSPQSPQHGWVILQVADLLETAFGDGFHVRTQLPMVAGENSEPEPDITVVAGDRDEYLDEHPSVALLSLEVAKTTQAFDKSEKADLYASIKIEDYWVLDLERRELTVMRKPTEDGASRFGWRYALTEVIGELGEVEPLAAVGKKLKVAHMLPPVARDS